MIEMTSVADSKGPVFFFFLEDFPSSVFLSFLGVFREYAC